MQRPGYLIIFFNLLFFSAVSQVKTPVQDITGLWKGTLYTDTLKQYYQYEIGISEENGKLSGFSHTWFILDDKQYYGVKKLKISRQGDKIIIEDAGLIANNYPVEPAKGVRQLNVLELNSADSIMKLTGSFTTNANKHYSPLTGSIYLERKNDYWQSALVPHLQELNLTKELSFVKEDFLPVKNEIAISKPKAPALKMKTDITTPAPRKPDAYAIPVINAGEEIAVKTKVSKPDQKTSTVALKNAPAIVSRDAFQVPEVQLTVSPADTVYPIGFASARAVKSNQPAVQQAIVKEEGRPAIAPAKPPDVTAAAFNVFNRITLIQQTVSFKSDSLQLSLYDNGEVDGDTVSVLMNGNIIMSKERLSTNAVRKTIFIPQNTDTVQLLMYAENLGTIPPNTGLLVVKDGKDIYEIRFSGDLQKNAAIILKRKRE